MVFYGVLTDSVISLCYNTYPFSWDFKDIETVILEINEGIFDLSISGL